jgi:glutamate-5-semialdehyde dehydrogenase
MSVTNALPVDAASAAKSASHILATLPSSSRDNALTAIHTALSLAKDEILAANARDLVQARKAAENGELSLSIVSRLDLGKKGKWEDMLKGILDVRGLEDPGTDPHTTSRASLTPELKLARLLYVQDLTMGLIWSECLVPLEFS